MTVSEQASSLAWLHCNICHRSFDHHNRFSNDSGALALEFSDLPFYFTGCGHFFCESCCDFGRRSQCSLCQDRTTYYRMAGNIPEKVAIYLRPPIGLLEDSLSVILIEALRKKVQQQKDLLGRAKQELTDRMQSKVLSHTKSSTFAKGFKPASPAHNYTITDSPVIRNHGRLSLKSPRINARSPQMSSTKPFPNSTDTMDDFDGNASFRQHTPIQNLANPVVVPVNINPDSSFSRPVRPISKRSQYRY